MMTDYCVTFTAKERAALVSRPFDPNPAPGQVVGENLVSLISTGSERGGFTQQFPEDTYPMQTGSSSIARVIALGEGVTNYQIGDLFYHNEHHTRYVKLSAADTIPLQEGAKPEHLIFGRYSAVSMTSIYHMKAKPADKVIVTGLGMVGHMCAAVLQCFGYQVHAVDLSEERRQIASAAGIERVGESLEALGLELKSCAALLECSGNERALKASIPYLRQGGEAFQVGVPWHKTSDWDAHELLYSVFYGYISIHGGWEWSIPRKNDDFHSHSSYSHIRSAMELIAQGKIRIPECMYQLCNPADCHKVYTSIAGQKMNPTSMILDWRMLEEE